MSFQLQHVWFRYGKEWVIQDFSSEIPQGKTTVIVGPNGAGKTTLLRLLLGYRSPEKGNIFFQGKKLSEIPPLERAKALAFIPQKLPFSPGFTVEEFVSLGFYPYHPFGGKLSQHEKDKMEVIQEDLALTSMKDKSMQALSGGEQQRVLLAQALVKGSPWLLMDEPFLHLDPFHQQKAIGMINHLKQEQKSIILVSHLLHLASRVADFFLFMKRGKIIGLVPAGEAFGCKELWKECFSLPFSLQSGWMLPHLEDIPRG